MPLKTHLDDEPTLNLTAMLDVMFLLIIFFMLGTRFIDDERKIGLRVPEVVDRGTLTAAPARKEVNVFRDGKITLDKTTVTLDESHHTAGRRPPPIQRPGSLRARRRPGRVPERRGRVERLQAGRHPGPGHHGSLGDTSQIEGKREGETGRFPWVRSRAPTAARSRAVPASTGRSLVGDCPLFPCKP